MDAAFRQAVVNAQRALPEGCRYAPAAGEQLTAFEREFGPIPEDFRWFLATCGGGVCGHEWLDGIRQLRQSHLKFRAEASFWKMRDVFVIGWDGAGNPFGIEASSGRVLVEDHNFGGIHEMAASFRALLARGLDIKDEELKK